MFSHWRFAILVQTIYRYYWRYFTTGRMRNQWFRVWEFVSKHRQLVFASNSKIPPIVLWVVFTKHYKFKDESIEVLSTTTSTRTRFFLILLSTLSKRGRIPSPVLEFTTYTYAVHFKYVMESNDCSRSRPSDHHDYILQPSYMPAEALRRHRTFVPFAWASTNVLQHDKQRSDKSNLRANSPHIKCYHDIYYSPELEQHVLLSADPSYFRWLTVKLENCQTYYSVLLLFGMSVLVHWRIWLMIIILNVNFVNSR
jgi:hypothetical protein